MWCSGMWRTLAKFERGEKAERRPSGRFEYHVGCDAKVWRSRARNGDSIGMKSASANSVANGRAKFEQRREERRREATGKRAVEENASSVTAWSRC
jgi:hypothetical protein